MKRYLLMVVGIFLSGVLGTQVFANEQMGATNNVKTPCKNIAEACKAAGKGGSRHDIFRNCVKPIMMGKTVDGVKVDPMDVQACKEKMPMRRMNDKKQAPASQPATQPQAPQ